MKLKYFFALILIVTALLLLGTAAASGDITNKTISSDANLPMGTADSQRVLSEDANLTGRMEIQNSNSLIGDDSSSDEEINLSVDMEIGETEKHVHGIGVINFDVPLIITAKLSNGVVHNVKLYTSIPDEFKIVSYNGTIGKYDSETGIWDIGDLDSSTDATLTILTNLTKKGTYVISVNATADCDDAVLTINDLQCTIEASSKVSSGISRTSRIMGARHTPLPEQREHETNPEPSTPDPEPAGPDEIPQTDQKDDPGGEPETNPTDPENKDPSKEPGNGGSNHNTDPNNGGNSNQNNGRNSNQNNAKESGNRASALTKSTESLTSAISGTFDYIKGIFDSNSSKYSNSKANLSKDVVKSMAAQDYAKFPILIFAVFLIALLGIVVYDKFKH
jgi:hypothetical protein